MVLILFWVAARADDPTAVQLLRDYVHGRREAVHSLAGVHLERAPKSRRIVADAGLVTYKSDADKAAADGDNCRPRRRRGTFGTLAKVGGGNNEHSLWDAIWACAEAKPGRYGAFCACVHHSMSMDRTTPHAEYIDPMLVCIQLMDAELVADAFLKWGERCMDSPRGAWPRRARSARAERRRTLARPGPARPDPP